MLLEITNEFSHLFSDQDILSRELLLYYSYGFSWFLPNYGAKIELPLFFFFSLCNIFRYPLLLHASTVPIISSFNFLLVRIFIIANFPNFPKFLCTIRYLKN